MIKKTIMTIVLALMLAGLFPAPAFAAIDPPEILAEAAVLIDAKTGEVLFDKNMFAALEPASTTKIMTCLLALENLTLDQVVTVGPDAPFADGSKIFLFEGEQITVSELLYALMLPSANDAAIALAEAVSGNVDAFAALMNKRAKELGAQNTNFVNPNGLHLEGHTTSAYDLAMISREAIKNPDFLKFIGTYEHTIPATNMQAEPRLVHNTNRLIYDNINKVPVRGIMTKAKYEGAYGIKTGYTSNAGGCLVAGAERNGTNLIAVVLKSTDPGRFGDCIALLDYGFENYYSFKAVDAAAKTYTLSVNRGATRQISAHIAEDRYLTLPKEASKSLISTKEVVEESVKAPVEKGQQVGKIEIRRGSEVIGEVPVLADAAVAKGGMLSVFGIEDKTASVVVKAACILGGILLGLLILFIILKIRQAKRRKALRQKRALEIAKERERKQREMEQRRWPY